MALMGSRFRARVVPVVVTSLVMLAGCGGRSDAQKAFLVGQSSSLGRCTLGEGRGDFGAAFDQLQADSWNRLNSEEQAWARVMRWQITSKPKSPPGDVTVMVTARFEISAR